MAGDKRACIKGKTPKLTQATLFPLESKTNKQF